MSTITPAARLHELCVRLNLTETFIELGSTGPPNDPTFKVCVEISSGIKANGVGKSKKEARHNAAKLALDQMNDVNSSTQPGSPTTSVIKEGSLSGNEVGKLNEYCAANKFPAPRYICIDKAGQSHQPTFTMKCELNELFGIGRDRSKQLAKHKAAKDLYDKIEKDPLKARSLLQSAVFLTSPTTQVNSQAKLTVNEKSSVIGRYASLKPMTGVPLTDPNLKYSQYHVSMENMLESVKGDLEKQKFSNPEESLELMVQKLGLELSFHEAREISDEKETSKKYFVFAVVNSQPPTIQLGEGESCELAISNAALSVLKYWRSFLGFYSAITM